VQTVGPKMAIAVLSGAPPRELLSAVAAGDVSRLRAPGVGKRTAERIIVELREKVAATVTEDEISVTRGDDPRSLAREALAGLGYAPDEIESLLDRAEGDSAEQLISHALRSTRR
jgi:Holliday junction DNA helicase RuvA